MKYSEQEIRAMRNHVIESSLDDNELLAAAEAKDVDAVIARLEVLLRYSYDEADARDAVMTESLDVSGSLYTRVNLYGLLRQIECSARHRYQAQQDRKLQRVMLSGSVLVL